MSVNSELICSFEIIKPQNVKAENGVAKKIKVQKFVN
jgi:hypothetical protein